MYEGAVYQPDETHSEQLLSSALTRFSLRWPSLNCLMYEGAVYQMRPIQNSSSFLLCSPECLYICWDPNYFKCPSLNCLMYEMKVLSPRWDPFRTAHLFCSAHQIVSTVTVTLSKLSVFLMYEGAVSQMRTIQNSSSLLLCSPKCLYICCGDSGAVRRISQNPLVRLFQCKIN